MVFIFLAYFTLYNGLQRDWVEREVGGGIGMGNTCKPMAVLFQCMTKFTTKKKKIKKAECRIDAFELWCQIRLSRVPWTARRSNQSILKEISPEGSLEGLMLKLKLQYFGYLMWRADSLEKTLMLGKSEGRRRRGRQRMRQLDGITDSMDMIWVKSGSWWWTGRPGMLWFIELQRVRHDWAAELNWTALLLFICCCLPSSFRTYIQLFKTWNPGSSATKAPWT